MCQTVRETIEYMTVFSRAFSLEWEKEKLSKKTNLIVSRSDRIMRGIKEGNGIGSSQD